MRPALRTSTTEQRARNNFQDVDPSERELSLPQRNHFFFFYLSLEHFRETMPTTNSSLENATARGTTPQGSCGGQSDFTLPLTVKFIVYTLEAVASLLGNALIIGIIRTNQKLKNAVTNYFILNLAAADILISLVGPGFVVLATLIGGLAPPNIFGSLVCKTVYPTVGLALCSAILSLVVIAVDRFLAIRFPMRKICRLKTARLLVLLIWLASLITCSPLIYAMKISPARPGHCMEQWTPLFSADSPRVYTICFNIAFYFTPLALITFFYGAIIRKVWTRQIPGQVTDANQRLENKTKKRVLKMLMTVVLVFAACWLPINLTMVLTDFDLLSCVPSYVRSFGYILAYSNAAINPFIYLLFSRDYRRGATAIVGKVFGCCWRPQLARAGTRGNGYSMYDTGRSQETVAMEMSACTGAVVTSYKSTQELDHDASRSQQAAMEPHKG